MCPTCTSWAIKIVYVYFVSSSFSKLALLSFLRASIWGRIFFNDIKLTNFFLQAQYFIKVCQSRSPLQQISVVAILLSVWLKLVCMLFFCLDLWNLVIYLVQRILPVTVHHELLELFLFTSRKNILLATVERLSRYVLLHTWHLRPFIHSSWADISDCFLIGLIVSDAHLA